MISINMSGSRTPPLPAHMANVGRYDYLNEICPRCGKYELLQYCELCARQECSKCTVETRLPDCDELCIVCMECQTCMEAK